MRTIDLNADVGEGAPHDAELIPLVASANIACGGHAGDQRTMEAAARAAIQYGVAIGAHPGHEDREHFGRRELPITPDALRALLERQTDRLHRIVVGLGGEVRYLKLHGALYHQAGRDKDLANAVVGFLAYYHTPLSLLGQSHTALSQAAARDRLAFYTEAFPDRAYHPDGTLAPRTEPGAVLTDPISIAAAALDLVTLGEPRVIDGHAAFAEPDSLCLHGDSPGALAGALTTREKLANEGVSIRAFAG